MQYRNLQYLGSSHGDAHVVFIIATNEGFNNILCDS